MSTHENSLKREAGDLGTHSVALIFQPTHPNMARYIQLRCSIGSTGFARWEEGTDTAVVMSSFQSPPMVSSSM